MKKMLFISLIMLHMATLLNAQKAEIKVGYDAYFQSIGNGTSEQKNQYILLADSTESKFYSPMTEYLDSLKSSSKGAAEIKNGANIALAIGNFDALPQKDGSYYIVKSFKDGNMRCYDSTGMELFYYDESPDDCVWEITDSTRNILGYECTKAICDYHGRKWEAWFTPEIPINNGPWKLNGLPGLILEASTEGGEYSFIATGLEQTAKPIGQVYNQDEYERTDRISFLKSKRAYIDNPAVQINAQLGVSIPREVQERLFKRNSSFDLIETDYK